MIKLTPPMGWNSWNTFGENINEKMIFETADVMAESGLRDKGYEYLVIDDCWSLRERDENGRLVPDPEKFPHGMKGRCRLRSCPKGWKFGMYSCAGNMTCAGYPGSYEHEFVDAETFASWDVDFLKYDYCYHSPILHGKYLYRRMGLALENCGRDILFSACSWGADETHEWIKRNRRFHVGVPPATSLIPGILSKISWHSRKNCIRTTRRLLQRYGHADRRHAWKRKCWTGRLQRCPVSDTLCTVGIPWLPR